MIRRTLSSRQGKTFIKRLYKLVRNSCEGEFSRRGNFPGSLRSGTIVKINLVRNNFHSRSAKEDKQNHNADKDGFYQSGFHILSKYVKEKKNTKALDFIARKLSSTKSGNLRSIYIIFLESSYFVLRIHGIRGIVTNRIYDLKARIEKLSTDDPHTSVQKEALSALDQM